jgi:hypothetical protein
VNKAIVTDLHKRNNYPIIKGKYINIKKGKTLMPAKKTNTSLLKRSFNLRSPKGMLIFFILVFAILGGAYYVYNTYAAVRYYTPAGYVKVSMSGKVTGSDFIRGLSEGKPHDLSQGRFTTDTYNGKTYQVFGNSVNDDKQTPIDLGFGRYINMSNKKDRKVRACVKARDVRAYGVKAKIQVKIYDQDEKIVPTNGGKGGSTKAMEDDATYRINPSTKYKEKCSDWREQKNVRALWLSTASVTWGAAYIKDVKFEWK